MVSNGLRLSSPPSRYAGIMRLSMSSRLKPKVIWVRSLVPKLKKSASSANSSARKAARGVSIMVPMDTLGFLVEPLVASAIPLTTHERARAISSRVTVSGIMTSTMGLPPLAARSAAASMSACTCMAYKPGFTTPRRTPRVPSIGLCSAHSCAAFNNRSLSFDHSAADVVAFSISSSCTLGKNSCNGGSSKRTVTGSPSMAFKMSMKSFF